MANRRKDRKVPKGFSKYEGGYEKQWYDIYTWNGVTITDCWPNAGTFHSYYTGKIYQGSEVFAVRAKHDDPLMREKK